MSPGYRLCTLLWGLWPRTNRMAASVQNSLNYMGSGYSLWIQRRTQEDHEYYPLFRASLFWGKLFHQWLWAQLSLGILWIRIWPQYQLVYSLLSQPHLCILVRLLIPAQGSLSYNQGLKKYLWDRLIASSQKAVCCWGGWSIFQKWFWSSCLTNCLTTNSCSV